MLDEVDRNLSLVERGPGRDNPFFLSTNGYVRNNGFHIGIISANCFVNAFFGNPGYAVSDILMRSPGHFHIHVNIVGIAVRKEQNCWFYHTCQEHGKEKQHDHSGQYPYRACPVQHLAQLPFIKSHNSRPCFLLKFFDHFPKYKMEKKDQRNSNQKNIGHRKCLLVFPDKKCQIKDHGQRTHDNNCIFLLPPATTLLEFLIVFVFHKRYGKYRIEHVCYKQRCKQCDNQRHRQIVHKLPDNARPES